jgi:hypothetical protein
MIILFANFMAVYFVLRFSAMSQLSIMTAICGIFGSLTPPFIEGKMCPMQGHLIAKAHIGSGIKTVILNLGASD